MYRALTWLALRENVPLDDADALTALAREAEIYFEHTPGENGVQRVFCQGHDVTEEIRGLAVSRAVSGVSSVAGVREVFARAQRKLASEHDVVMDGRDIGTVVLPDARCKIFLTASVEERARRRMTERGADGLRQSLEEIKAEIEQRDLADSIRKNSPMKPASDSVILDTTSLSLSEVIEAVINLARASEDI